MQSDNMKLVNFEEYCPRCEFRNVADYDDPCHDCLNTPARDFSHKPERFKEGLPAPKNRPGSYTSKQKIEDYFYDVSYDFLDYNNAELYFERGGDLPRGACTAIRNGRWIGRNFDWTYDNAAQFLIRTSNKYGKYATKGIGGGIPGFTEAFVSDHNNDKDDLYRILPFMLQDGVNENYVFAEMNVVPTWGGRGDKNVSVPEVEEREKISCLMLVRYILDNFNTARRAVEYIRDYVSVYFSTALHQMNYEIHYMVADQINTYCLEFTDNQCNIIDISDKPYITNFHLKNVIFNENGKVYTPSTQDDTHNAFVTNHIHPLGSGLERYNTIVSMYNCMTTREEMTFAMSQLYYTRAYIGSTIPWYTEFVDSSRDLTVFSTPEDYKPIMEAANELYLHRSRDTGKTWHTVHSVVYDLESLKMYVRMQQRDKTMIF